MARTRIGIIGLGMAVAPHAASLVDLADRVEVAYAFSPTEKRRKSFGERFPFPLADSLDAMLTDKSVDAVMILTPPNTHLRLARQAFRAGKHVLLEKPLEVTTTNSEELVRLARAAKRKLGIVLQHRFRPSGRRLIEIVRAGELGRLVAASASVRVWRPQSYYDEPGRGTLARDGGGVLLTQAIHTLDLLIAVAGEADEVSSYSTTTPIHRMETEDLVAAAVRFGNGALGTIEATTAAYPGFPERIEVIGEKGTGAVSGTELRVRFADGREEAIRSDATEGGTGADPMAMPRDYHREIIRNFLDAIETGGEPEVTGEEALKVHRLIDALLESGRSGAPVKVRGGN
jgi:predicted dehydrogenase